MIAASEIQTTKADDVRERGYTLIGWPFCKPEHNFMSGWPTRELLSAALVDLLDMLLDDWKISEPIVRKIALPGVTQGRGGGWHFDEDATPRRGPLRPGCPVTMTCLWAASAWTPKSGCTELVPGSHRQLFYAINFKHAEAIVLRPQQSVAFVGSHVAHRTGVNLTRHDREARLMRFTGLWRG